MRAVFAAAQVRWGVCGWFLVAGLAFGVCRRLCWAAVGAVCGMRMPVGLRSRIAWVGWRPGVLVGRVFVRLVTVCCGVFPSGV